MILDQLFESQSLTEEFGSRYAEQLAQQLYDEHPDLDTAADEDEVLDHAFALAQQELGQRRAHSLFAYDEDFAGDLLAAYSVLRQGQGVSEGVNVKQIKKDIDSGMSLDAVIGKHANRRTTNTDEIRQVIQQHAWEKRKNKTKEQGVEEARYFKTSYGYAGGQNPKTGKKYKHPEQIRIDREARKKQQSQEKSQDPAHWNFGSGVVAEQGVRETTGVTDYAPKSQGGTRRELIAKYHKTKNPRDAEAARRAGATQKELQGVQEGSLEEYGDTAKGQKMLGKVHKRAADRVTSKQADKDPAYARKAQQTQDRAWERLAVKEQGVSEGLPAHVKKSDVPPAMRSKLTMKDIEAERPQGAYRYRVGEKEFMDLAAAKQFAAGTGQQVQPIREGQKKTDSIEEKRDRSPGKISKSEDPCWSGYHMVGTKKKGGRTVPNCVPGAKGAANESLREMAEQAALSKLRTREHPSFQVFAESWYRAHGGR